MKRSYASSKLSGFASRFFQKNLPTLFCLFNWGLLFLHSTHSMAEAYLSIGGRRAREERFDKPI
jgi:hypothetical protein